MSRANFPRHVPIATECLDPTWCCPVCNRIVSRKYRPGRQKVYCTNACRQRAYRWRRANQVHCVATPSRPATRAITLARRHALRTSNDFVAGREDPSHREVTVCGVFARSSRYGVWTHFNFLPDGPWVCETCARLVVELNTDGGEPTPTALAP